MKLYGYIYKYTFPNGKVYIGQTRTTVQQRHYTHMYDAKRKDRGGLVDIALAKYGEIFPETIETIEVEENEATKLIELLNDAEVKWIKHYDSTNRQKGYNVQNGGNIETPETMILQEKWHEIFEKDKWGVMLGYLHENLENIGKKLYLTKEKLNKDERYVWYGYKFNTDLLDEETCFSRYFHNFCEFDDYDGFIHTILDHAWHDLIVDVQQTIWKEIYKKKDKIIKEYWATSKIKRN